MAHHVGDEACQPGVDARVQRPDPARDDALSREFHRRLPVAAIARARRSRNSIAELERCVRELGIVGCNLNPDPSGGHWTSTPLTDKSWYPFYEKMVELDVPAMVHVSALLQRQFPRHRRALHQRRHHRLHAVPPGRSVQGFPDTALHHPAWRRRRALSLGPLSRARRHAEEAAPVAAT